MKKRLTKNIQSNRCINLPDAKLPRTPHTKKEIVEASRERVSKISQEVYSGLTFIQDHPKSVTFFGSARFNGKNPYYQKAERLANRLAKLGFAVVTGGGPGIMEAANKGASEINHHSIGMNIKLPHEQVTNPYVKESVEFYYFFTRKVSLSFSAEAYIYFPGGFGTMDEFFEILTLVQTHKIPKVPIILVGSDYWKPLDTFIKNTLLEKNKTISKGDMSLYKITDDEDEIVKIVKKAPLRKE